MTPFERCAQRLVTPQRQAVAGRQQAQPFAEPGVQAIDAEQRHPSCGELDRERQAVELAEAAARAAQGRSDTVSAQLHTLRPRATSAGWMRWLSLRGYGLVTSALFGAGTPPLVMRRRFEFLGATPRATLQRRYPTLNFGDHAVGRLAIESIRAAAAPARAILYLHGGGYFMGSPASYRRRAMRLSFSCDAEVFVPDYRLAPEHPYPAALDDALAAWRWLRRIVCDHPVHVVGDSAGGGLALALMLRLRDLGEPLPDAAVLLSPWTDLTASGVSVDTNRSRDLWFTRAHLESWARYVIGDADPISPYLSPAFGSLAGLPPLMLLVGEDELLLDDALRVHRAAASAGVASELLVGPGMQHDWPLALPWLPESREAWQRMARFLGSQLHHEPRSRGAVR